MKTKHGSEVLLGLMRDMELKRMGGDEPAGLMITSLPWPRAPARELSLGGASTWTRRIGQWPGEEKEAPRRLLMAADGCGCAPEVLKLCPGPVSVSHSPPDADDELFEKSEDPYFMWERRRMRINYDGRSIAFAMGLRTGGEWRWWEGCRLVVLEDTPSCRVVEMGGAIPLAHSRKGGADGVNPWLHKHNWLYGHILARLHSNGVCEVFAHHINARYVDDGSALSPAVPVLGIWTKELAQDKDARGLCGTWDGSRESFAVGGIKFDVAAVARMATPEKPGRFDMTDGMLAWQPYRGFERFGGPKMKAKAGDGFSVRAEDENIPRGMARTLRFSFNMTGGPARVARYLAPAWWYGLCEEFTPAPLLPVISEPESKLQLAREWLRVGSVVRGFEDGGILRDGQSPRIAARGEATKDEDRVSQCGEGDMPYAQFLNAWRYADAEEYDLAMRSAYQFSDVNVDHGANLVRSHGFPHIAFALPMNRAQGPIAAFLETGDDYLMDTAEKLVESAWRLHRNAWPRMGVGRDACFVRGAVMLYRYFANEHFLNIARQGAMSVALSQRPNGSFGDQGGGTGLHQWGAYISKPWMGQLATNGVLDYLELFPDEPALVQCLKRYADWLMTERSERDGVLSWGYQHDFDGMRTHQQADGGEIIQLPSPEQWHQENLARLMGWCALRFNNSAYLDAWAESHAAAKKYGGYHAAGAALQFLPHVQAQLFQATLDEDGGLRVTGVHFGPRTFKKARVVTPRGKKIIEWEDDCRLKVPAGIKVGAYHLAKTEESV